MIKECVDVAVQAPVSVAGENWRFLVVTDGAIKGEVAKLYSEVLLEISKARGVELKATHKALINRLHESVSRRVVTSVNLPSGDSAARPAEAPAASPKPSGTRTLSTRASEPATRQGRKFIPGLPMK